VALVIYLWFFSWSLQHASPVSPGLGLEHLAQRLLPPLPAESTAVAKTSGLEYNVFPRDADGCYIVGSHPLLLGQQELEARTQRSGNHGYQWHRSIVCHKTRDAYCVRWTITFLVNNELEGMSLFPVKGN